MQYDVLIIGAGVTGCAIARELSRYKLRVALAEAGADVSMGSSRANSAIVHAGYDAEPGTAMARLNTRGNAMFEGMCRELDVPFNRCGSLVLAYGAEDELTLARLLKRGEANGVPGLELLSAERARELEPALSHDVMRALWAPSAGITSPYQLTIAMYENARSNGLDARFDAPVTAIGEDAEGFCVEAGDHEIAARYIVNAAGLYADDIARMVGDGSFTVKPRKGEYLLLDHDAQGARRVLFQVPSKMGKGILVSPTVDGNTFVGPTAIDVDDKDDASVTADGLAELRRLGPRAVPSLDFRSQITAFSGVRAITDADDFIIKSSACSHRFIHAAGICSPGLTAAPAIAEEVADILRAAGLELSPKADYSPKREGIKRFADMTSGERALAVRAEPRYGHVICRCETVTEAEIIEAIRRGARTLDGVKRRVRAGMGRCQGGFCAPRVMELIARETGMPMESVTKNGGASYLLAGKTR